METAEHAPANRDVFRRARRRRARIRSVLVWLVVVGALIAGGRLFVPSYTIPSASMVPTIAAGDRVFGERLTLGIRGIQRGDVIAFTAPGEEVLFLKRVIAVGGDWVNGLPNGSVYVNDHLLHEPYALKAEQEEFTVHVPEGHLWVMGDNRAHSADSRVFGPVHVDTVDARAWFMPGRAL